VKEDNMLKHSLLLLLLCSPAVIAQNPQGDLSAELKKLHWQEGPSVGAIGNTATIAVPEGYVFLGDNDARRFIELAGNPRPDTSTYLIAPRSLKWFAVFEFEPTGYIKDDETIDSAKLLEQLKKKDEPQNAERKRLGVPALYTDGWAAEPHYDATTKRLEWGVRIRNDKGDVGVNYTSRILGRTGVMHAVLVSDLDTFATDMTSYKGALGEFAYKPGETYAEFKSGDKVAEFGLAALILGGAAAVATKKGFWAILAGFFAAAWKLLVAAAIGLSAWIKSLFKKKAQ
jgi:uncharacterized membrane-anchored protein